MSLSKFLALLAVTWSLSLVFMMPSLGLVLSLYTFGLGLFLMVPIMTLALYLPAFLPVFATQTLWAKGFTAVLLASIAAGPHVIGEMSGQKARADHLSGDKIEAALDRPAKIVDLQGLDGTDCKDLCRALLTGGMVEELRILDSDGDFQRYFTAGGRGPFLDAPPEDEQADLIIAIESHWSRSDKATFGFKVTSKHRQIIKDGRTQRVLAQSSSLNYEVATLPTYLMPRLDGLTSGGNNGGLYIGRTEERQRTIGGTTELLARLRGLGIPLGDPDARPPEMTLEDIQKVVDGAPTSFGDLSYEANKAIEKWVRVITTKPVIDPKDLQFFDQLQQKRLTHAPAVPRAMVSHPQLRDIYLEKFVQRLERQATNMHDLHHKWLMRNLLNYRFPEDVSQAYSSRVNSAIRMAMSSRHSKSTLRLILAGAAFGIDPVPALERLDFTSIAQRKGDVANTLYWLQRGACAANKEDRQARAPSLARLLSETVEGHFFSDQKVLGLLKVLRINGMDAFVDEFAETHLSDRSIESVKNQSPALIYKDPDRALQAELEFGCGRSEARLIFPD